MAQIRNRFDSETIIKILKGAGIAGGGVALTYIFNALPDLEFGKYTALVVGILSVLINALREFLKGEPK